MNAKKPLPNKKHCLNCGKLFQPKHFDTKNCSDYCAKISYWKNNREKYLLNGKKYRETHKEEIKAYRKKRYLRDKEKELDYKRRYCKTEHGKFVISQQRKKQYKENIKIDKLLGNFVVCPKCNRKGLLVIKTITRKTTGKSYFHTRVHHNLNPERNIFDSCYFNTKQTKKHFKEALKKEEVNEK